ncbi:MAG TPA: MOSC domain-containing protein [Gammaproteobacteria bacterium]|nr:MOSC domain-containing protein [Gammaproteobacteria bacterium]
MTGDARELTLAELEAGLDHIRGSPRDAGTLEMIVRRPRSEAREVLEVARLDPDEGLVGDRWAAKLPRRVEQQITLMNSRVIALVAQDRARWPLAGDQLYVDLDLGAENVPAGTRLAVGAAVVEVSAKPHLGCGKFRARYGFDAVRFVNSARVSDLRLRGINARIVSAGDVRVGDAIRKVAVTE